MKNNYRINFATNTLIMSKSFEESGLQSLFKRVQDTPANPLRLPRSGNQEENQALS